MTKLIDKGRDQWLGFTGVFSQLCDTVANACYDQFWPRVVEVLVQDPLALLLKGLVAIAIAGSAWWSEAAQLMAYMQQEKERARAHNSHEGHILTQ